MLMFETLRRQQRQALSQIADITQAIEREVGCDDAFTLTLSLARLVGVLRIHIAQEGRNLYPMLIEHHDAHVVRCATSARDQMEWALGHYEALVRRWSRPADLSGQYAQFQREALPILRALTVRIEAKSRDLYPLLGQARRDRRIAA